MRRSRRPRIEDSKDEVDDRDQGRSDRSPPSHVVLATGYELTDIVPAGEASDHLDLGDRHAAAAAQRCGRKKPSSGKPPTPISTCARPADGRVICGGEDEEFTDEERRDALIDGEVGQRIAEKLGKLFPNLDTKPEFAWAGSFGTTTTGLPYIGAVPRHPAHLCRDGLWRQRHHLFADRLRDRASAIARAGRHATPSLFAFKR